MRLAFAIALGIVLCPIYFIAIEAIVGVAWGFLILLTTAGR